MELLCIFPVGGNNEKNIPIILEKFEKEIAPILNKFGVNNPQLKFPKDNYKYVENKKEVIPTLKGRGVIESLQGCNPFPDYVICCDGSGKIPYENIILLFQEFMSDSKIYCVMANRMGNKAISDERYLIERFEIFSLKKLFNHNGDIVDGQCGLWGYKTLSTTDEDKTKKINLSAEGYEIELDLLSEVLSNSLGYSFVNIELPKITAPTTSFNFDNNISKLKFFLKKYPNLKSNLAVYISEFEKNSESKLLFKTEQINTYWNEYKLRVMDILGN